MSGFDIDALINEAVGGNDAQQKVTDWLDTGYPPLNKAISGRYDGGLPCGRMVEMFGPPSSGKTAIATQAMISAQRKGGVAVFMDHENSFDVGLAEGLGLNTKTGWVYKAPTTFEESVDMVKRLAIHVRGMDPKTLKPLKGKPTGLPMDKPIVVVFDSLAQMVPQSKFYDDKGRMKDSADISMHDKLALATATSQHLPALCMIAQRCNICLIFLNQIRVKPGVAYGDPITTPGGTAPEFNASVRIGLSRSMIKSADKKQTLGQIINANVKKNKVSAPFRTASWNFMFREDGTGFFDVEGSLVEALAESGKLERDGNGYIWTDGKKYMKAALKEKIINESLMPNLMALLEGTTIGEVVVEDTDIVDFGDDEEV